MNKLMARDEPRTLVKIDLDINCLQLKNLYTYSNNLNFLTAPR